MTKQEELIGSHPENDSPFGKWFSVNDIDATPTKCHRELTEKISCDDEELVEWMGRNLITHHYSDFRLNQLKKKFNILGFPKYAEQNTRLPVSDKVKKGNATEILLTEYIQSTLKKELIKVFKLKYNPNVDQAIKGDDTLMVDIFDKDGVDQLRVYLGEAKFRKRPNRTVVNDISDSLANDKMPLSYTFLVDEIAKEDEELALKLDEFIIKDIKNKGDLVYTGLLLSNNNTSRIVENNLNSDNPSLILISMSIDNPQTFIDNVFAKAEELMLNPVAL